MEILLECDICELDHTEVEAIDIFDAYNNGFNSLEKPCGGCYLSGELAGNSKYSDEQIEYAFKLLATKPELTNIEIAVITNISKETVDAISGLKVHKRLHIKYPEYYELLVNRSTITRFGKNKTLKSLGRDYPKLISPDGVEHEVDNCSAFSKLHGLNNAHVIQVLKGKEKQHKGWKAKIEVTDGY